MKSVTAINDLAIITTLQQAWRLGPTPCLRERAHAVLLSHRGYSLDQIADILGAQYQTVSNWIDQWEDYGIIGLYKHHGGSATAIFSTEEVEEAQQQQISILQELQLQKERADEFQERMEQLRQRNDHVANILELDEAETRRHLIDSLLVAAGWDMGENLKDMLQVTQEHPVKEQPTKTGDGFADYVLWDDNGMPMAVVEAKRTNTDAEKGR